MDRTKLLALLVVPIGLATGPYRSRVPGEARPGFEKPGFDASTPERQRLPRR
jgi:hypothetical protein